MQVTGFLLVAVLSLALGCGGPSTTTTSASKTSVEFRRLCQAIGVPDGRISREAFLAKAKDKEAAAQLFDACDLNHDLFVTEEEAAQNQNYFESLKNQVILFRTTR
uniref:EF-hand domain-containing protein n=1 Tax=Desulfobacca acetoxidans TaxID=60893 RepID=A0A7C3V340_9BACT